MSKFGLALGGGGARGLAHIGVLKVLDTEKIKINSITGCSMGAIVGGLYAYFGNAKQVEDFILQAINNPEFEKFSLYALNNNNIEPDKNYFEKFFDYIGSRLIAIKSLESTSYFDEDFTNRTFNFIPDAQIQNLKINFSAITTDLISGEEINLTKGSLRDVLRASSAIPGIFPPVKFDNYLLVDGSISESVPVSKVKEIGADKVLAVDVTRQLKITGTPKNIFEILYRTEDITSYHLSLERLKEADLIIRPQVKNLTWADFNSVQDIIKKGEIATEEMIPEIKKMIFKDPFIQKIKNLIKPLAGK
ncbi:MAG TPA: patatin-like phospholipase family protein [Ignavibacteria bacterium]|nr:patatin-like phospholipase family protein [Ignavibacteria bacterium]